MFLSGIIQLLDITWFLTTKYYIQFHHGDLGILISTQTHYTMLTLTHG